MALRASVRPFLQWAWIAPSANALNSAGALFQNYTTAQGQPPKTRTAGDVPAGHINSDLSSVACNINLMRRRDLTLRQDVVLWQQDKAITLGELFKGRKVIVVGFPGGHVCTEKHIPGYIGLADTLSSKGVDHILAVTVEEPAKVQELAEKHKFQQAKLALLADRTGSFMRLLGLELAAPDANGEPRCQRFAAIVDDGLLLKVKVEQTPAELQVSDAQSMLKLWENVYQA